MPGQVGLIQATEVIKLILGKGKPLIGQFLVYNALEVEFRLFPVKKSRCCPLCNEKPEITQLTDYDQVCSLERTAQASV